MPIDPDFRDYESTTKEEIKEEKRKERKPYKVELSINNEVCDDIMIIECTNIEKINDNNIAVDGVNMIFPKICKIINISEYDKQEEMKGKTTHISEDLYKVELYKCKITELLIKNLEENTVSELYITDDNRNGEIIVGFEKIEDNYLFIRKLKHGQELGNVCIIKIKENNKVLWHEYAGDNYIETIKCDITKLDLIKLINNCTNIKMDRKNDFENYDVIVKDNKLYYIRDYDDDLDEEYDYETHTTKKIIKEKFGTEEFVVIAEEIEHIDYYTEYESGFSYIREYEDINS